MITETLLLHSATPRDFKFIETCIEQFQLDSRALHYYEFVVARLKTTILGFGRIRKHPSCDELCSLGVIEPERMKGIGKELVKALILKSKQPLYLVCIIPEFFEPIGFKIVDSYPNEMQEKLNYCTNELVVKESYVVMKYEG